MRIACSLAFMFASLGATSPGFAATDNDVVKACAFPGADAGVRINAAIASLPRAGGIVDARCLNGEQTISVPIAVGSAVAPVQLELGAAVFTTAATITVGKNSSMMGTPSAMGIGGRNGATRIVAAPDSNLPSVVAMIESTNVLQDLVVDGDAPRNPKEGVGILVSADRATLTRVTVQNAVSHGIEVVGTPSAVACCTNILDTMSIKNGGSGLFGKNSNDMKVVQSEFEGNGGKGIELDNAPALRIETSDFGGNLGGGLQAYASAPGKSSGLLIVIGNQFGANTGHDIDIEGINNASRGNVITGNSFIGKGKVANTFDNIHIQDSSQNVVVGNFIASYTGKGQSRYGIAIVDSSRQKPGVDTVEGNSVVGTFGTSAYFGVQIGAPDPENLVINGDFALDQYHAGATSVATAGYFADRWTLLNESGAHWRTTAQDKVAGCPRSSTGLVATSVDAAAPAASAIDVIAQKIDAADLADLVENGGLRPFVFSFWAKASVAGDYAVSFTNGAQNRSYVATVPLTAACQYFALTVPGDEAKRGAQTWDAPAGQAGLVVGFDIGSGAGAQTQTLDAWHDGRFAAGSQSAQLSRTAGATLVLTGVRLRRGTADAPPLRRSPAAELALARQFYRTSFPAGTAPRQNAGLPGARCVTTPTAGSRVSLQLSFLPPMRRTPKITTFNPSAANANWRDVTEQSDVPVVTDPSSAASGDGVQLAETAAVRAAGDNLCIHFAADGEL